MGDEQQGQALPRPVKVTSYEPFGCGASEGENDTIVIRFVVSPMEHVLMTISKEGAVGLREQLPSVAIATPSKTILRP